MRPDAVGRLGAAERGGAGDSGIRSIFGQYHRHFRASLVLAPLRQLLPDPCEKLAHERREPATENKHVRLQKVDDVSGPNREKIRRFSEDVGRKLVALAKRLRNHFGIHGIKIPAGQSKHL
jgi:hypothetical protein